MGVTNPARINAGWAWPALLGRPMTCVIFTSTVAGQQTTPHTHPLAKKQTLRVTTEVEDDPQQSVMVDRMNRAVSSGSFGATTTDGPNDRPRYYHTVHTVPGIRFQPRSSRPTSCDNRVCPRDEAAAPGSTKKMRWTTFFLQRPSPSARICPRFPQALRQEALDRANDHGATVALGLSLSLFSLTIAEALPPSQLQGYCCQTKMCEKSWRVE